MRYVDSSPLAGMLSPEWHEKARVAYAKVKNPPGSMTRAEALKSCSPVWSEVKELLKRLSHNKCWYCESPAHRIIGDVDHHRPKGLVKHYPPGEGVPDEPGYWWFANDWRNFRYSCEMCNRLHTDPKTGIVGGKGSYFPLLDPKNRRVQECDYEDLFIEDPLLLDPTVVSDPALLTFTMDGEARSAYDLPELSIEYRRAETSINVYHLNHTDLKEARQSTVCVRIEKFIKKMDRYYPRWLADRNDVDAQAVVREAMTEIKKMIHERAQYSAAAISALQSFRGAKRQWINSLLIA